MSRLLSRSKSDNKIDEIKLSLEKFLTEVSESERQLFSYQEVENILLDIYTTITKG